MDQAIINAVNKCSPYCGDNCRIGIILGSGLGDYVHALNGINFVEYDEIEAFPKTSVTGHKGRFAIGDRFGKRLIIMQGRFHYYEGHSPSQVAIGVRVMKQLGVS